jgi:glyoxylase-like metal-dependent hydrolase (beta-lactamase superfamily II)
MRVAILSLVMVGAMAAPADRPRAAPAVRSACVGCLMLAERVTARVWYKHQPPRIWSAVIGNVGIIEQSDGVVLVDSGGSIPDGRDVVAEVARLTHKPVKAIAITHWHNDHPLGIPGILERYPKARVIATAETARMMREIMGKNVGLGRNDPEMDRRRRENFAAVENDYRQKAADPKLSADERRQFAIEARYVPQRLNRQMGNYIVLPTETFTSSVTIDDPVAPVHLYTFGRGNTGGDLVAWLPRQRVLFTGDLVVAPSPYGYNSTTHSWIGVLRRLKRFPFAFLVPGHGTVQRDTRYLDTMIWSMRDVDAQVGKAIAAGKSADHAWQAFDKSRQIQRFGARTPWARRWLDDYWLEPIVSSAYRELKGEPVIEGS